jgi:hypothetical protein
MAMLEGVESNTIIVGAYTDRDGGVCPMLAAHRRGGRTDLASFARAWDRYTRVGKRSRKATEREVRTLRTMLGASLSEDDVARGELAAAIADLKAVKARRAAEATSATPPGERKPVRVAAEDRGTERRPAETGERDRSSELHRHPGWAWLRVFRRYDEYEAAVARVRRAERTVDRREVERV